MGYSACNGNAATHRDWGISYSTIPRVRARGSSPKHLSQHCSDFLFYSFISYIYSPHEVEARTKDSGLLPNSGDHERGMTLVRDEGFPNERRLPDIQYGSHAQRSWQQVKVPDKDAARTMDGCT